MLVQSGRDKKPNIFSVEIDDITVEALIDAILKTSLQNRKAIVANVNVHAMNLAYELSRFRNFLIDADIVFCDGFGVKWGGYMLGYPIHNRNTPPDWIDDLCAELAENDLSLFFLGGKQGVAQQAGEKLMARHKGLRIVGYHHGFFDKEQNSSDNKSVIEQINQVRPNILVLGFGMPKQEYWLLDNWIHLRTNVAIPAGAFFDYVAESVPRAPHWMTDHGLEWLGRLFIEPRRLWKRYLIGNPLFLSRILRQRFTVGKPKLK
jgi:N-acetylglucosaminyldiphosphoundecaprenol N-acetyl-beta-D-mannosaminyltransferase